MTASCERSRLSRRGREGKRGRTRTSGRTTVALCSGSFSPPRKTPVRTRMLSQPKAFAPAKKVSVVAQRGKAIRTGDVALGVIANHVDSSLVQTRTCLPPKVDLATVSRNVDHRMKQTRRVLVRPPTRLAPRRAMELPTRRHLEHRRHRLLQRSLSKAHQLVPQVRRVITAPDQTSAAATRSPRASRDSRRRSAPAPRASRARRS